MSLLEQMRSEDFAPGIFQHFWKIAHMKKV